VRWLALAGLAIVLVVHLARRHLDAVEVRGRSMAPTLLPGDRLLVMRGAPRAGDVVVARDPRDRRRELVKRVGRIDSAGIHLRGDNPGASTDARTFGALDPGLVKWRAVLRYWPARRMGRI
jgi:nickel-type superoxide dismutase maturation protease